MRKEPRPTDTLALHEEATGNRHGGGYHQILARLAAAPSFQEEGTLETKRRGVRPTAAAASYATPPPAPSRGTGQEVGDYLSPPRGGNEETSLLSLILLVNGY
jgi:hypothetical protein